MRNVPKIWEAWRSGIYVGDTKPSTRVTVEEQEIILHPTGPVVGQWERGPARWFQRADTAAQIETEIPGVTNVNINRSSEPDAGTCDITIRNVTPPTLGAPELPRGQFSDIGHYTPDRGDSQEAAARWGHAINPWHEVLVPNALLRTYQGFGGHEKTVHEAQADGDIVLNGVWLVDDVTVNTDGTINLKCRDMAKLLIDQQLVPPLVPQELYPLVYRRYRIEEYAIPADPPPGHDVACPECWYPNGPGWHSSSDEYYGAYNAGDTGHPPADSFDISVDPDWRVSGEWPVHQRSYWLSEPKGSPHDTVWIEMDVAPGGTYNEIYFHAWKGFMEGRGCHLGMVSVLEHDQWAPPETNQGGITPEGIPYVCTFVPGLDRFPGETTNGHRLPRDYKATRFRITLTNLLDADDFPSGFKDPDFHGGGFRGGCRKMFACFNPAYTLYPSLVLAAGAIPVNTEDRYGYWQARTNGRIYAFGDARVYPPDQGMTHVGDIQGMAVHPSGRGYWTIDNGGRVVAAGEARWHGDGYGFGNNWVDITPTPSGDGYWILRRDGEIFYYGDASNRGRSFPTGTVPSGAAVAAQSIESHPTYHGYWVLWSDGHVEAHDLTHHGDANRDGFQPLEWVTTLRRTSTGNGYWILSGAGIVQARGDARHLGNAGSAPGITADRWPYALYWEIIPSSSTDAGYLLQRADGSLSGHGDFLDFGSIGAGHGELRYDGNYKDYTDIIRDLLLWAGFYLYRNPQPDGELPDVYGNLETTGAYNTNDPLPQDMFDKRPVLDAIRDIKAIVGYVFFIDAEGGARWEAPNWWAMGNYLIDGTPYSYMPEIDERVQLTSHSVVRSGSIARSEIIIATEYPYASTEGQKPPEGIVKTRIEGSTAKDLKGIISPAIWTNREFLKVEEQQTMAEILDMQIWFQRRTANVQCVANPLIDVNDQIRIIERQTGEVYVHYVRSISFSHDVQSGQFTMSLTTFWLGGTPFGQLRLFYACAARPQGDGYWQVSANGEIYAYGAAELHERHEDDSHISWPIAMVSTPSGQGYWTLDQNGKVLSYGDAVNFGGLNRQTKDAIDLAVTPTGDGYWILLLNGEVHTFGDAVFYGSATLPPGTQARSIESHPTSMGYWVLFSNGVVQEHNLVHQGDADRYGFKAGEILSRIRRTASGDGYWIVSTSGIVQARGDAADQGSGIAHPDGATGLVWDIITNPSGGYAIQRADGNFEMFDFTDLGVARVSNFDLEWALVAQDTHTTVGRPANAYSVSPRLMEFLKKTGSPSANNAATNEFNSPTIAALEGSTVS